MQRSKRPSRRLIALILGIVLAWLCWLRIRPVSLLDRSTRIPGSSQDAAYYRWRSDHEMVLFPVEVQPGTSTRLCILDTTTGKRTETPASKAFPVPAKLNPNYLDGLISPDGKQLLWIACAKTGSKAAGNILFTVHSLDGSKQFQWTGYGNSADYDNDSAALWQPDNRRWLEWTNQQIPNNTGLLQLVRTARLHDLDAPGKDRTVVVPQGTRTLLGFTPDGRLISGAFGRNCDRNYSDVTLVISSLEGDGRAIRKYAINIPAHTRLHDLLLSPQGDRLLWWLHREPSTVGTIVRKLRGKSADLRRTPLVDSLWVSRIDGGEMREIGMQEPTASKGARPRQIDWVQWRPDGRQISFYFGRGIYMTPVE